MPMSSHYPIDLKKQAQGKRCSSTLAVGKDLSASDLLKKFEEFEAR